MMPRRTCEDCGAPIDPKPRVRFCPECVHQHKLAWKAKKYRANAARNANRSVPEKTFKIISSPGDEWPANCVLVKTDVLITLHDGHFPPGMVFEQCGKRLQVIGKLFTRQILVEVA